jgi:hypothetical protein
MRKRLILAPRYDEREQEQRSSQLELRGGRHGYSNTEAQQPGVMSNGKLFQCHYLCYSTPRWHCACCDSTAFTIMAQESTDPGMATVDLLDTI